VAVTEPLDLGPAPDDHFDPAALWWRHELLHRRCLTDPGRLTERFAPERDEIEAAWIADPPSPNEAFAAADRLLDRWIDDVWRGDVDDRRPVWVRRYWRERARRAALPEHPPTTTRRAP
jgi:hypothetical protein